MSEVYFVQPKDGGPIRVGTTQYIARRTVTIASWHPNGVEVIATLPGSVYREGTIHYLLRPFSLGRDWFRSCPDVWRLIHDVVDRRLEWLPSELSEEECIDTRAGLRDRVLRAFGSDTEILKAAGFTTRPCLDGLYNWGRRPSAKMYSALNARELFIAHKLPDYMGGWPADRLRQFPAAVATAPSTGRTTWPVC